MSIFHKQIGSVALKEGSDAAKYIEKMQELAAKTDDNTLKKEIEEHIRDAAYGEQGENQIMFELKSSGIDMYILRDIYLEYNEDFYAQIDFLLITRKKIFILECKNLYGDISIDEQGNFVRITNWGGRQHKEGIYSPITQNQRHLEVIKKIRSDTKGNILSKTIFERNFNENYKSLIVLANDKTISNLKNAPKDILSMVIRKDQLIKTIKDINASSKDVEYTNNEMYELAQFFLNKNTSNKSDYSERYRQLIEEKELSAAVSNQTNIGKICPKCGKNLVIKTAKKGTNIGKQFYACPGFPKCRYTEDISNTELNEIAKLSITLNAEPVVHEETKEERQKRWDSDWEDV